MGNYNENKKDKHLTTWEGLECKNINLGDKKKKLNKMCLLKSKLLTPTIRLADGVYGLY